MEIITYGNECPPFTACWCEKHPQGNNHPKCQKELTLGNVYLDVLLIVSICVFILTKTKSKKIVNRNKTN